MTFADAVAARLPMPADLERRCVALATLDAILSPGWQYRYYSFNRRWDPQARTCMGSMRNGPGDDYFILFLPDGSAAIKGFDHESPVLEGRSAVAGVLDSLPLSFAAFANEPAFSMGNVTFCLWNAGDGWRRSASVAPDVIADDGSSEMLRHVVGDAADYVDFARDYFEVEVSTHAVERFLCLEPLTPALAAALREDVDLSKVASDIDEIGYPLGG
jgi:hypothetical protein